MNFKSTALLFGLLLGMLWLFGLMLSTRKTSQDEGFVLPTMRGASLDLTVDYVKILRRGKDAIELEFRRDKDNWKMEQPPLKPVIRAEAFKVNQLVNQIKDARKDDEADVSNDFAAYELAKDQPNIIVTLRGRIEEGKGLALAKKRNPKPRNGHFTSAKKPRPMPMSNPPTAIA